MGASYRKRTIAHIIADMRASRLTTALLFASLSLGFMSCARLKGERKVREPLVASYSVEDPLFAASAGSLLGGALVGGNDVVELINGDRIFPAMLEEIRKAKRSITMEHFIWSSGKVSAPFVDAFVERAKAGVKVRLIVDAIGSVGLKKADIKRMEEAGVQLVKYHSVVSPRFFRANLRTHRKLLVVDGRVGFNGGVCLSDDWQGDAQPPFWRDTHFKARGPVVAQLQAVFAENWLQMRSEVLHGEDFFPKLEPAGKMLAQVVRSGHREGPELTRMSYLMSFASARKSIRISHSYFAPDTLMIDTLVEALKRGVAVEIIVPRKSDNPIVGKASRPRWHRLLDAGAKFWEYEKTLYHCKIVIVDDAWSVVGSVNFDDRSFNLSDEANLNVLDRAFAAKLVETFEADKKSARRLTKDDMKKQSWYSRLSDHFFGLFRAQL